MPLEIPIPEDTPDWTQETTLDGARFRLHFKWNDIDQSWYLSVHDAEDSPIYVGRRLSADFPVLHRCVDARRPVGELVVLDALKQGSPLYADLGKRVKLIYINAVELKRDAPQPRPIPPDVLEGFG